MGGVFGRGAAWCALAWAVSAAAARGDEPELRTWKDLSNQFKLEARYVKVEGEKVVLRKPDGSEMQVVIDKLCAADRTYVAEQQKKLAEENPFKPRAAEDPFKPAAPAPAARPSAGAMSARPRAATATASGEPAEIRSDVSAAPLAALPLDGSWKVDAGPAPAPSADAPPRAVPVPPTIDFFERRKGFAVNAPATHAVIGYTFDNPKPGLTRLVALDLKSGKLLINAKTEGAMAPLAVSDSGDQVLMRRDEFGPGGSDRLELWDLTADGFARTWKMIPYGDVSNNDRDVKWAAFLGTNRFATLGGKGRLVVWDLDPVRAALALHVDDSCTPAVSPDGKYLAFAGDGKVGVLDVGAGRVAAVQALPSRHAPWPALAFSPSGKRLACLAGSTMYVWNTADGSLHREVLLTPVAVGPNTPPAWSDDDHVLVANRHLIDVDSQVRLWEYDGADAVVGGRDGICWFLLPSRPNQAGAVVPAKLPQPEALQALKQALADPDLFILKAGATVSIDPNGIPDASRRGQVVDALTQKLAQMQVKVAPGAPLTLVPSVEPGKEQEISYRTFGRGFRTDNFKVRPQISKIKFMYRGKPAWESGASTLPHFEVARLGPNESLADHVKKFEQPNYAFFEQVALPRLLARPRPDGSLALGRSQVSTSGVR